MQELPGRIVILGGYGEFGGRIARALASRRSGEIVIAGRNRERADELAAELGALYPYSHLSAAELDTGHPHFVRKLGAIAPIVVIHAAGPFQTQDYSVAEACLACRSHYLDLADGRDFVAGFGALDRDARRRDVLMVTGASTLPGISSAVVDELAAGLTSVRSIETSIAPAGASARGRATVAAVLGYCGRPIEVWENGEWRIRYGWQHGRRVDYGRFDRRVAVCDVPDLGLFPEYYAGVRDVTFRAGPEPLWQHVSLWLMAALTRAGIIGDWSRFARLFARADQWLARFGSGLGAMQVRVTGTDAHGASTARSWNLIAEDNQGPEIPCVPAIAIAKKLFAGTMRERGARPCLGMLTLGDVAAELEEFAIDWQVHEERDACYLPT